MLRAIQAFEAAARHENYVDAATELKVTPAAVGQQVRALEAWLGTPLFRRLNSGANRLLPTDGARAALPEFREGLDRLDAGLRLLKQNRQHPVITISASQAFVGRWLLPRLDKFAARYPAVSVRLDVADRLVDLERGEADLAIRFGAGRWDRLNADKLMGEEMFPVCSPQFLAQIDRPRQPQDLLSLTLIHDSITSSSFIFPRWDDWLGAQGVRGETSGGLQINSTNAVVQTAINGSGIALTRKVLVSDELRDGRLVRLFPQISWPIPSSYYLVYSPDVLERQVVLDFVLWLKEEVRLAELG